MNVSDKIDFVNFLIEVVEDCQKLSSSGLVIDAIKFTDRLKAELSLLEECKDVSLVNEAFDKVFSESAEFGGSNE